MDVVRRLFERFQEAGIEGVVETMAEDVVIEIPPELSAEPDVYEGHAGARRYFAGSRECSTTSATRRST